ncbi:MAG: alpha/beta hydrolase [Pseudomonadota bacterium]
MAVSLILVLLVAAVATLWRLSAREARARADSPPLGQFITVEGLRLHYVQSGAGPDLVLIHGASGSMRDFTFDLVPELAKSYRVTVFDRPGLGYSDPLPDGDIRLASQARILRLAATNLGVTNPIVVGQSYGGAVALAWALDAPPAALVLISAASLPWPGSLDPWYQLNEYSLARWIALPLAAAWVPEAFVRRTIDGIFAPDAAPPGYADYMGIDQSLRRAMLDINIRQVNALRDQIVAMEPRYATLTLPIEMVHGDADTIVPLAVHSAPLAARLPSARLTVIPGAGHMPHHTHRQIVLDAIDRAASRAGLR